MEHAATLDLEDFEDSELQDRLERARRQAGGRSSLIGQLFAQAQDIVTVASFAAGLIVYAPWLIVLLAIALLPAFIGEAHFNAQSYSLNYARTPERRELDYVRQTGASAETAKEVKIFGLNAFLIERYRVLATSFFEANRRIALRRAGWGSLLSAIGTIAYYAAYAYIVWRTIHGDFSIGDLTFLAGSFRRLRTLLENLLLGFSQVAGQAGDRHARRIAGAGRALCGAVRVAGGGVPLSRMQRGKPRGTTTYDSADDQDPLRIVRPVRPIVADLRRQWEAVDHDPPGRSRRAARSQFQGCDRAGDEPHRSVPGRRHHQPAHPDSRFACFSRARNLGAAGRQGVLRRSRRDPVGVVPVSL
jgi:hypothetical protein